MHIYDASYERILWPLEDPLIEERVVAAILSMNHERLVSFVQPLKR